MLKKWVLYTGLCAVMSGGPAAAAPLGGTLRLDNQDILVAPGRPHQGRFDLRTRLPADGDFVMTRVYVSFDFRDDPEWVRVPGQRILQNTGQVARHQGSAFLVRSVAGHTDYYYRARQVDRLENEGEVAEVTIGRNKIYSTTILRRDVTREDLGRQKVPLGTYRDPEDGLLRQHFRVTDAFRETRLDGYDGPFHIQRHKLDLTAAQDLARTGYLDFELAGQGDYYFVSAILHYEGQVAGDTLTVTAEGGGISPIMWLSLGGLPLGAMLWRKSARHMARKPQRSRRGGQKRALSRQRVF